MNARLQTANPLDFLACIAVVVVVGGAAYEALAAAGVLELGDEPGEGPVGGRFVSVAAALGLLIAFVAVLVSASCRRVQRNWIWVGLPLAAAAYVVARFYAFDPYYAPTLRRASEDGAVSPWWVFALCAAAVATAVAVRVRPLFGAVSTALVVGLTGLTALAERGGH